MVDLEELVGDLSEVSEWEYNFRLIKTKGREVEKLPSTIKVIGSALIYIYICMSDRSIV